MSGHGIDGTVNGATLTTDRFGNVNSAYDFDGSSQWINTDTSFDYQYRTVSVWAKADDTTGSGNASRNIISHDGYSLTYGSFFARFNGGDFDLRAGGETSSFTSSFATSNNWFHVVLVRNNNTCSYYIDGNLAGTGNCGTNGSSFNPNPELVIGVGRATTNQFFDGKIDDLRIYNRVLSLTQIDSLYNEQSTLSVENEIFLPRELTIYPNPSGDKAIITFDNVTQEQFVLEIYDINGKLVQTVQNISSNKVNISTSHLASGIYHLRLTSSNKLTFNGRLMVK